MYKPFLPICLDKRFSHQWRFTL